EVKAAKVILVAPWLNRSHEEDATFFDFELRPEIVDQVISITVFASDNDHKDVTDSVDYLKTMLPGARFVTFHGYGHFCFEDMKTTAFPELLASVLP
ncbi:MAG TPA: hypothetical protein VN778_04890, partial [Verrucomicrobiae bacterium]|nr:hypothetical protein [Verrucomicrobiae bacterium]